MRPSATVFAGLVLLLLAPSPARAEDAAEATRVAVVPVIVARHERPAAATILDAVTKAARSRFDLLVLSEEESFASAVAELSERVLDCGPDPRCVAGALGRLGVPLGLVVVVNLDLEPPLVGVQLIDCAAGQVAGESIGSFDPRATPLAQLVTQRTDEALTRAGHPSRARLVVHARPPEAAVRVGDRAPDRLSPGTYTLEPGRYSIRAEAPGHQPEAREVELAAGAELTVELELTAERSLLGSPWLWIAVGVVAVAGGTTAVLLATQKTERWACVSLPGVDCP